MGLDIKDVRITGYPLERENFNWISTLCHIPISIPENGLTEKS